MLPVLNIPQPGLEIKPMEGIRVWTNPLNGFSVVEVHYTADPTRRGDWRFRASPKYGGLRSWRWRKEQEIDWGAQRGALIFEQWDHQEHVITPFVPPDHWPRWILFDPGWRNPASIIWAAIDMDASPNLYGFRPIHLYREFYKARRSAQTCASICYDYSQLGATEDGVERLEWIEEIILDPAARQEHQAAANGGDDVNDFAENVLEKFTEQIQLMGWNVPVRTGDNDKSIAIEECIARLGRYWVLPDGMPLYDAVDAFRDPTAAELVSGAKLVPPTLFFHACVIDGAREMQRYRWREWAANEVAERHNAPERPIDKDDHTITNLIRFVNFLRAHRSEDGIDLDDFHARPKPRTWVGPDEMLQRQHKELAERFGARAKQRRRK